MKFISVRDLRLKPRKIWRGLETEGELVITLHSKPIALLTRIEEGKLEESILALRQSRAWMALEQMQSTSVKLGLNRIPSEEIAAEIKAVRKSRKK